MSGKSLEFYDDLFLKTNDLSEAKGPTVIALAHNEMYFLPAWLSHYRRLGAKRFIILDDASTDGTLAYLERQRDVMVVGSHRRYGDTVPVVDRRDASGKTIEMRRMVHLWRMMLAEKFCINDWVVQVALDEFLVLPSGKNLEKIFEEISASSFDAIMTTMLDVYPKDINLMKKNILEESLCFDDEWFFDSRPHVKQSRSGKFFRIYSGSRARLFQEYLGVDGQPVHKRAWHLLRRMNNVRKGRGPYLGTNSIRKYSLMRWRSDAWMGSAHQTSLQVSVTHHLPLLHMKFTPDLWRRAQIAISEKSYFNSSSGYVRLIKLLKEMERRNASFLCPWSRSIHDPEAFAIANLIIGFDSKHVVSNSRGGVHNDVA